MEFNDRKAIYLQIADYICDRILSGEYAPDEKLPSVREFAAEVEVNVNTVARSFEWLQTNGVVQVRRGLGNFVSTDARREAEEIRHREFMEEQLPELFRAMQTLGIGIEEIVERCHAENK